jgi:hypothetical protein
MMGSNEVEEPGGSSPHAAARLYEVEAIMTVLSLPG